MQHPLCGTQGCLGGEFGLPWCPHGFFPAVKLLLAEEHGAESEQRWLEGLGDKVGSQNLKAESIK